MRTRISTLSMLTASALFAVGSGMAADRNAPQGPDSADKFVSMAAQDGLAEVQLGELAMRKSQNQQVRQFAQRMMEDHGKANDKLLGLAMQKNLIVEKRLNPENSRLLQKLSNLSGAQFDQEYAKDMVSDHKQAVSLFKRAEDLKDPELAQFAKSLLPTLEEHQKMADALNSSIRTASAEGDKSSPSKQ